MARQTPRQELEELDKKNGDAGHYGMHNQFAILIKNRHYKKATEIMQSLNTGFLWANERQTHNEIYEQLLDGVSVKNIKAKYKN